MKIARLFLLVLACMLALSPVSAVFAQEQAYTFQPYDGRFNTEANAGQDTFFSLMVENKGNQTINNFTFSAEAPEGWTVKFDPAGIAALEGFGKKDVDATISIPTTASSSDFFVTFKAKADGMPETKVEVRFKVNVPIIEPKLEMKPLYPSMSTIAGQALVFDVEFLYTAAKLTDPPITMNLSAKAPPNWEVAMTPQYEKDKKLTAMTLKPGFTFGDKIIVTVTPPFMPLPEPGDYTITLTGDSGQFKASIDLKAVITARYNLFMIPSNERYNTTARAGRENSFSLELGNLGTAAIDKINFSSTKPDGWTIEFKPEKVDSLSALDSSTIDVVIKPPAETIAGDYNVTLSASGTQATAQDFQLRVTVDTPTVWGWVGVGIIGVVVLGLIGVFMRFSRR